MMSGFGPGQRRGSTDGWRLQLPESSEVEFEPAALRG